MPSFLRGLLDTKGLSNNTADLTAPKNAVPRAISNSRGGLYTGVVPNMQSWDIDQAITQGYERVIWIYRCVDAIASNSSKVPMVLRQYDDMTGKQVEDKDLLRLLNRRPNIYETAQQFRYRLASQALMSRRGVFIEVVKNRMGRPIELHLLPPGVTRPIPDPQRFVKGYQVQTITQGIVELEPDRVIWIRVKPHPTDVYAQMTPLVAAGLAADTDFLARLYNRNFLANDGRPGMLVAVQGQLGHEDAEEIRRRFSGGPVVAGQTTVIEADGITAQDFGSSPRDVQWQDAVKGSKEDILLAFGVPESQMGNASGRTFDNADAEAEVFWQITMQPFMDALGAGFDVLTAEGLKDEIYVAHDYNQIDVLQRQERRRHDKALEEFKSGVMTIDQYLEIVGREQLDVPGSRVLWIPQGNVPIGKNDKDTEAAAALMPVGQAQPTDPAQSAQQGAARGVAMGQRTWMNDMSSRAMQLAGKQSDPLVETTDGEVAPEVKALEVKDEVPAVIEFKELTHPYDAARRAIEAELTGYFSAWSKRQERTVVERIGGAKARKNTRHWDGEPGTKALDAIYIVSPEQWADDLVESIGDVMKVIGEKEALKAARMLDKAGVIEKLITDGNAYPQGKTPLDKLVGGGLGRVAVLQRPVTAVEDMIRESALRQSQRVADRITELDAQGASIEDIKKEVRSMIGSRSSWKRGLATASATSIMEGARNSVYEQGGKYVKRIWRTMHDEKVRPSHRKAFGQKRGASRPFRVGGALLMYPGDLTGPIEETANCRCWVELEIVE